MHIFFSFFSAIHKLEEVAYFVTPSAWSVYPFFPSGNIIVSSIPGGLFVLSPYSGPPTTAPPSPAPPTQAPTPPTPPTQAPTPSGGGCVMQKDCGINPWCTSDLEAWCADQGAAGSCP